MLVLGRKPGQSVVIGSDVMVTVIEIKEGSAKLGFTAPKEVAIDRLEVRERMAEEAAARQKMIEDQERHEFGGES